jgi:indoleamine 2,3-dioxygenase
MVLLLSPPHAVGTLLDVVLSLYNSYFHSAQRLSLPDRRSPADFDIDLQTGFFPTTPLSRLPPSFDLWEDGLTSAVGQLPLGQDASEEAEAKREFSQKWRDGVKSVRKNFPSRVVISSESDL